MWKFHLVKKKKRFETVTLLRLHDLDGGNINNRIFNTDFDVVRYKALWIPTKRDPTVSTCSNFSRRQRNYVVRLTFLSSSYQNSDNDRASARVQIRTRPWNWQTQWYLALRPTGVFSSSLHRRLVTTYKVHNQNIRRRHRHKDASPAHTLSGKHPKNERASLSLSVYEYVRFLLF